MCDSDCLPLTSYAPASRRHGSFRLNLRRKHVFEDSFHAFIHRNAEELRGEAAFIAPHSIVMSPFRSLNIYASPSSTTVQAACT